MPLGLGGFITAALLGATPVTTCPQVAPSGIGAATAPVTVRYFLDPLSGSNLTIWLQLRTQIATLHGQARAEVRIVESSKVVSKGREEIALWLLAAQQLGGLEAGLRILEREGNDRILVRLATPQSRAELAKELKLDPSRIEKVFSDPCLAARLRENTVTYRREARRASGALLRPPVFATAHQPAFDKLSYLVSAVDQARHAQKHPRSLRAHRSKRRRGVSARLRRPPPQAGLMIGDVGAPHRLVVFLRADPRPRLTQLGPALTYRRLNPGKLAIQLIVRGEDPVAQDLRRRMCAAQSLGLELEYVNMLAAGRTQWSVKSRDPDIIEALLDAHEPEKPCSLAEPKLDAESERRLPDGIWLDGAIVNQTIDLEHIADRIGEIEGATNPSDAVFSLLPQPEI